MNSHVAIALAVFLVLVAPWAWRQITQIRASGRSKIPAPPEEMVEERVSESGRFKAVAFRHRTGAFRVQVYQKVEDGPADPFWITVASPSFADQGSLPDVLAESLRAASGESQ